MWRCCVVVLLVLVAEVCCVIWTNEKNQGQVRPNEMDVEEALDLSADMAAGQEEVKR